VHESYLYVMSARTANLLAATARLVEDAVEQGLLRELPFGASAPAALISIAHQPGLSIERLRRILGITHSGTVRLLDRLQADELVTRHKTGGRDVQLTLTARGRRTLRKIETARLSAVQTLIDPLPPDARAQLDSLLSAVLAAQTHTDDDLHRICRLCSFAACQHDRACPVDVAAQAERSASDAQ
jgi:MarR family transcriptional regulator, negative regulator of the multidrug operon emrRAB